MPREMLSDRVWGTGWWWIRVETRSMVSVCRAGELRRGASHFILVSLRVEGDAPGR